MNKLLLSLFLLSACALDATQAPAPSEFSMPVTPPKEPIEKVLRLKIEIAENDVSTYGINKGALYNEITSRLALGAIKIKDEPNIPQLLLRIKVIQADRAVAAFIQLGFSEEALLKRNETLVDALTWSQATMLSCAKEDLQKELDKVVVEMVNGFIIDYQKAMVPV